MVVEEEGGWWCEIEVELADRTTLLVADEEDSSCSRRICCSSSSLYQMVEGEGAGSLIQWTWFSSANRTRLLLGVMEESSS